MVSLVFILDTSLSMNQKTYFGLTYLDIGKAIIENFIRTRPMESDGYHMREKIYLFTTNFGADTHFNSIFNNQSIDVLHERLKNIYASGDKNLTQCILEICKLLSLQRLSSGIDTLGLGRTIAYIEPTNIILISNNIVSECLDVSHQVQKSLNSILTRAHVEISGQHDFYYQPYRWDYRMFVVDLLIPGICTYNVSHMEMDIRTHPTIDHHIFSMVMDSGGQWLPIQNEFSFLKSSLLLRVPAYPQCFTIFMLAITDELYQEYIDEIRNKKGEEKGFVSPFEYCKNKKKSICKLLINVNTNNKLLYPFPENYFPDASCLIPSPLRDAIPAIIVSKHMSDIPKCKYIPPELHKIENGEFPDFLKLMTGKCLMCYYPYNIHGIEHLGEPFGYISLNNQNKMFINIMPYNFPVLIPLMNEFFEELRCRPTRTWKDKFNHYISSLPPYYINCIRTILKKNNVSSSSILSDSIELLFTNNSSQFLRKLKTNSKLALENILNLSALKPSLNIQTFFCNNYNIPATELLPNFDFRSLLIKQFKPILPKIKKDGFILPNIDQIYLDTSLDRKTYTKRPFHNPYDIEKPNLINFLDDMIKNMCLINSNSTRLQDYDSKHSVSINQMGDYRINEMTAFRPLDPTKVRAEMFGNPFKLKNHDFDFKIDEAEGSLNRSAHPNDIINVTKDKKKKILKKRADRIRSSSLNEDKMMYGDGDQSEYSECNEIEEISLENDVKIVNVKLFYKNIRKITKILRMDKLDSVELMRTLKNFSQNYNNSTVIKYVTIIANKYERLNKLTEILKSFYD